MAKPQRRVKKNQVKRQGGFTKPVSKTTKIAKHVSGPVRSKIPSPVVSGGTELASGKGKRKRVSFGPPSELSADSSGMKKAVADETPRSILKKVVKPVRVGGDEPAVKKAKKKTRLLLAVAAEEEFAVATMPTDGRSKKHEASNESTASGPQSAVLSKKELREKRMRMRLKKQPNYEAVVKAKKIWEQLRMRKCNEEKRTELVGELWALVEGKAKQFLQSHDAVRVVQCLMALKDKSICAKLFDETKDELLPLMKSKYAHFFIIKLLKYGTVQHRHAVIKAMYGNVVELLKHSVAGEVVEYAYNEFANAMERTALVAEFYGRHFAVFKDEVMTIDELMKVDETRGMASLKQLEDNLMDLARKPSLRHSIVHRLFAEFFRYATGESKEDMVDTLKERLAEFLHTRDGTVVALNCVWAASAKVRKVIVKSLKSFVVKICKEEHGHLFLVGIFDCVDDTIVVGKVILEEMKKELKDVMSNKYGVKVLIYLLNGRDPRHFFPDVIRLLSAGDGNAVSKKDAETRRRELREMISPALLTLLAENARSLIFEPHTSMLALSILLHTTGSREVVYKAIADICAEEFFPCNPDGFHIVEHLQASFVLKHVIKNDAECFKAGEATLTETLVEVLPAETFRSWTVCNKGVFALVWMFETGIPNVRARLRAALMPVVKSLQTKSFAGARILLEKMAAKE